MYFPSSAYQSVFDESVRSSFIQLAGSAGGVLAITRFEHFDLLEVLLDSGQLAENRMLFRAGAVEA